MSLQEPLPSVWDAFAARYPGDPRLALSSGEAIYALDRKLIGLLAQRPKPVLSPEDVCFEEDLARTTEGGGFFLGQPFHDHLSFDQYENAGTQQQQRNDQEIKDLLYADLPRYRRKQIENREEERASSVRVRQRAYAMSLVKQELFRAERDQLRAETHGDVQRLGFIPSVPRSYLGVAVPMPPEGALFLPFYRRWSLSGLITWDLPEPLCPELFGHMTIDEHTASEAGVILFLPWYLLRDGTLDLLQLARDLQVAHDTKHLEPRLSLSSQQDHALGYKRLEHQFALYRYWHLALAARYGLRIRRMTERLDDIFGRYLQVGTDTVKKVRLDLRKTFPEASVGS